uniref:C-type lectin domain-containing protein n=1 Tax=Glossina palpalis gambiensis TaxID=67801 RepID=A0A1B0C230_9MUSC
MNGHLKSLDNESDLNAIHTYFKKNIPGMRWWWLSSNDLGLEGKFVCWANTGAPMNYTVWSSGKPDTSKIDGNCVHLWWVGAAEESLILSIFCMFSKKLIFLNVPNDDDDDDDDDDDNNNDNVNDVVIVKASQLVEAAKRFMWQQRKMKVTLL